MPKQSKYKKSSFYASSANQIRHDLLEKFLFEGRESNNSSFWFLQKYSFEELNYDISKIWNTYNLVYKWNDENFYLMDERICFNV